MPTRLLSFFLKTGFLIAALFLFAVAAQAQDEGAQRLSDGRVGDYLLSVWTSPEPAVHGPMHITARLTRQDASKMDVAPQITVSARAPHRDVLQSVMTYEDGRYVADLTIPYAETWTMIFEVQDDHGLAQISFPLEIQPAPINNNLIRLGAFLMLVVLTTGWWFWGRHPRKKRVRKRIFMSRPDEE